MSRQAPRPRVLRVKAVTALGRVHRRWAWRLEVSAEGVASYRILRPWPPAQWLEVHIDQVPGQSRVVPLPFVRPRSGDVSFFFAFSPTYGRGRKLQKVKRSK